MHAYFPLRPGAAWRYRLTQGAQPPTESTERVLGLRQVDGGVCAEVEQTSSFSELAAARYEYVLGPRGLLPALWSMSTSAGEVRARCASGLFLPIDVAPGRRWTYEVTFDMPQQHLRIRAAMEAVAMVQVEVPAGIFGALLVRQELRTESQISASGLNLPSTAQLQRDELYFAPGVGLVRAIGCAGSSVLKELVSYEID